MRLESGARVGGLCARIRVDVEWPLCRKAVELVKIEREHLRQLRLEQLQLAESDFELCVMVERGLDEAAEKIAGEVSHKHVGDEARVVWLRLLHDAGDRRQKLVPVWRH